MSVCLSVCLSAVNLHHQTRTLLKSYGRTTCCPTPPLQSHWLMEDPSSSIGSLHRTGTPSSSPIRTCRWLVFDWKAFLVEVRGWMAFSSMEWLGMSIHTKRKLTFSPLFVATPCGQHTLRKFSFEHVLQLMFKRISFWTVSDNKVTFLNCQIVSHSLSFLHSRGVNQCLKTSINLFFGHFLCVKFFWQLQGYFSTF